MARLNSIPPHLADAFAKARAEGRLAEAGVNAAALDGAAVLRGPPPPAPPAGCREATFQDHVNEACRWGGWEWFHHLRSRGTNPGFPDVIALRPGARGVAAELKVGDNRPTEHQLRVLELFRQMGFRAFVWRPEQWAEIVEALR